MRELCFCASNSNAQARVIISLSPLCRYGATLFLDNGPFYAPPPKYGGTLILMVPAGATGTFQVAFGSLNFMFDDNSVPIEPLLLTSAEITVVPEPATHTLLVLGLAGLAVLSRRRYLREAAVQATRNPGTVTLPTDLN